MSVVESLGCERRVPQHGPHARRFRLPAGSLAISRQNTLPRVAGEGSAPEQAADRHEIFFSARAFDALRPQGSLLLGPVARHEPGRHQEEEPVKLSELVEALQNSLDDNGDREVLVAQQPSYPLAARIVSVCDPEYGDVEMSGEDADVLWIATSEIGTYDRSPYAPRAAWDGGW